MVCRNCGNQLNDGAQFCPKCGQRTVSPPQNAAAPQQPQPPQQPQVPYTAPAGNAGGEQPKQKKNMAPVAIVAVLLVIVLGVAGYKLLSKGPADTVEPDNTEAEDTELDHAGLDSSELDSVPVSGDISAQDAASDLLAYIDQAEKSMKDAESRLDPIWEKDDLTTSDFNEAISIAETLCSDLTDMRKQAEAVAGIDAKLTAAADEYFDMTLGACNAEHKMIVFLADFYDYFATLTDSQPEWGDYSSVVDYYNAFTDWVDSAKADYLAINSCPSNAQQEWAKVGTSLDLLAESSFKVCAGIDWDDPLREQSGENMLDRFSLTMDSAIDGCADCVGGEESHAGKQMELASALAEEMRAYAGMEEDARDAYQFKNIYAGVIDPEYNLEYEAIDTIYPSLYNSYDSFLIIKTGCISGNAKILVEAEIEGFTQKYSESFNLNSAYTEIRIKPPAQTGTLDLSSAKNAQLKVTISAQDGTWIDSKTFPVTLKSKYDFEWINDEYGVVTQDNILCFLTPESPTITELKRQAIEEISSMTGGRMDSFVGYQNPTSWENYVVTYLQAAGLMRAMYEMGVRYNMDSFSISGSNQHILFPADVLEQKSGLCIETSLAIASALQSAGMHAFLVLPTGHAQVAVETWSGSGQYFLIETTCLSQNNNTQSIFVEVANQLIKEQSTPTSGYPIIYKSSETWEEYLKSSNAYVIDCDDSRILGLTPFAN